MHVVIIGNGIAGITCARHIRKLSDHRITVISSESRHFFARTALMYIYMGHMRYEETKPYEDWFWKKNRIDLLQDHVTGVDPANKMLELREGGSLGYDKLVIATGSSPNRFGWPGQELHGVQGLYSLQDLELMESNTRNIRHAVIVGGGLIGIEMAEMLRSRNIDVTFLVREKSYWNSVLPPEESELINRHIREHHIDLRLGTELQEIKGGSGGKVTGVVTDSGEHIECGFVGLTVGVHPNIGFLDGSGIRTEKGVVVNEFLETNIPDIYSAGDCVQFSETQPGRKPVEQVWYTGKIQGTTLAHTICGKRTSYRPGHWFNSAKFFDIEYMVYGQVPVHFGNGTDSIYWESAAGDKCVRLAFERSTGRFTGLNALGIRYRHHLLDKWLQEERNVDYVARHLAAANFDPEFYRQCENGIREAYNSRFPDRKISQSDSTPSRGLKSFNRLMKRSRP